MGFVPFSRSAQNHPRWEVNTPKVGFFLEKSPTFFIEKHFSFLIQLSIIFPPLLLMHHMSPCFVRKLDFDMLNSWEVYDGVINNHV